MGKLRRKASRLRYLPQVTCKTDIPACASHSRLHLTLHVHVSHRSFGMLWTSGNQMHIFLPIHAQSVQFFKMLHSFAEESLRGAAIKVSSVSSYWHSFFPRPCLEWVSGIWLAVFLSFLLIWRRLCYLRYFIPSYDTLHLIKWYLHVLLCQYMVRIILSYFQKNSSYWCRKCFRGFFFERTAFWM